MTTKLILFQFLFLNYLIVVKFVEPCENFYKVTSGDTCWKIYTKNKIDEETFYKNNDGINCENIQLDQAICIDGTDQANEIEGQSNDNDLDVGDDTEIEHNKDYKLIENCTQIYQVKPNDICENIWLSHRIDQNRFYKLNPNLDCEYLQSNMSLCLNDGHEDCIVYYRLTSQDKFCKDLAAKLNLNFLTFKAINPFVDCSKNDSIDHSKLEYVCIESVNPQCIKFYKISSNDTINSIRNKHNLTEMDFHYANPYVDQFNLKQNQIVCLEALKRQNFVNDLQKPLLVLSQLNPNLKRNFDYYFNVNSDRNSLLKLISSFKSAINMPKARKYLKRLEEVNDDIKSLYKKNNIDRTQLCNELTQLNEIYDEEKKCFCSNSEPVAYCAILFVKKIKHLTRYYHFSKSNSTRRLTKRDDTNIACDLDRAFTEQCALIDCCYSDIFCASFKDCRQKSSTNITMNSEYDESDKLTILGHAKLCIPGLNEFFELSHLDNLFHNCVTNPHLELNSIKSNMDISVTFNALLLKISYDSVLQYKEPLVKCEEDREEICNDKEKAYCYIKPPLFYTRELKVDVWSFLKYETIKEIGNEAPECNDELNEKSIEAISGGQNKAGECGKKLIGYYPSWSKKNLTIEQAKYLNHIIFAFVEMKSDGFLTIGYAQQKLKNLFEVKKKLTDLSVSFAVGGWENSQFMSSMASSDKMSKNFIDSVIRLLKEYEFDGIDIDWEYPVTGGANEGIADDKDNYVLLLKKLRNALDKHQMKIGRQSSYLISIAGASGNSILESGYDLERIVDIVDWINVNTYDYFGAWKSKWGVYTGPVAPLKYGAPNGFSGKNNVDWTMKYYVCHSRKASKIIMGLPFYGRYWENVNDESIDGTDDDDIWRQAELVDGQVKGGQVSYDDIEKNWLSNYSYEKKFHEKTKTPYLWSSSKKILMSYDDESSLEEKVKYADEHGLGGLMIWDISQDNVNFSLTKKVASISICSVEEKDSVNYKCSRLNGNEKRWWTWDDSNSENAGKCGESAPKYYGYTPGCDPDDPGYACCSDKGFCGSGKEYCECDECVDYSQNPDLLLSDYEPYNPKEAMLQQKEKYFKKTKIS